MRFQLDSINTNDMVIKANDIELEGRWILLKDSYFSDSDSKLSEFCDANYNLALCEDNVRGRMSVAKTIQYNNSELSNKKAIQLKRQNFLTQLDILEKAKSRFLPIPLDYFKVTNESDIFSCGQADELKNDEPVIIFDYIYGNSIKNAFPNNAEYIRDNISNACMLAAEIIYFEKDLYRKGLACTTLNPDNVIITRYYPKFVGVEWICPIDDRGMFQTSHINYGKKLKYYSAPELYKQDNGSAVNANAAFAYSLGMLLVSILLGRSEFEGKNVNQEGVYDYNNAENDRKYIKNLPVVGQKLDSLLSEILKHNPNERLSDLDKIGFKVPFNWYARYADDIGHDYDYKIGKIISLNYNNKNMVDSGMIEINGREYYFKTESMDSCSKKIIAYYVGRIGHPIAFKNKGNQVTAFVIPPSKKTFFPKLPR